MGDEALNATPNRRRRALPDTPLLQLAAERGWRVRHWEDDGTGEVEISPGIALEIQRQGDGDWRISVAFLGTVPPPSASGLATGVPLMLHRAAALILNATEAELAEVRHDARREAGPC